MDESVLFNGVMRAVLGGRRRRGRKAMGFLGSAGSALLSNPTALLGAAGVAWGIFETLQGSQGQTATGGAGLTTSGAGMNTAAPPPATNLPLPAVGADGTTYVTDRARRLQAITPAGRLGWSLTMPDNCGTPAAGEKKKNP